MDKNFELRPPPPTRPLPSKADIDRFEDELLLPSEADMLGHRSAESRDRGRPSGPVQQQVGVDDDVDDDDMHDFVAREDAVNARNAADEQAYAQAAAAAAAQAAAAGAAQDAINQAREAAFNRLNQRQKDFIQITNLLSGGKMTEFDFNYYNSSIQLNPQEIAEVQPFIYQTAASLAAARGAARGAAASGGKRKSKKYHYKKKSKKSKANKRRRSRSNKRSRSRK
jgi:hypothetical protein